ncbi:MAG: calcium/sodium antiporter [Candidatus Cloacimonadales bacterium]|nr:calcium/sodium antiporter [Candidatus Cloacimonadales bacterium]
MSIAAALLVIGFVILIKSADLLVNGASSLAKKFSISEIAIGLTIVAFGTSAPELIVNILSSTGGHSEICFGNVIGSNIFNTLMVLGIAGVVHPIYVEKNTVKKEIPFVFFGTILVFGLAVNFGFPGNTLSRLDGLILIGSLVLFFFYVLGISKEIIPSSVEIHLYPIPKSVIFVIIGIIGLFFGGNIVVKNAVSIARMLQVSEKFIGITIVALGTSLPELVTSVVAVKKKRYGLAVGNVIGSNLFNIFFVLGITALIKPIVYPISMNIDFYFLIIITLILFITMFTGRKRQLDRWEAVTFIFLYVFYIIFLIYRK